MHVEELLRRVAAAGITLTYSGEKDKLVAKPTANVTPEIVAALRERREEVIGALRSGVVRSEAEVFDLAREFFPDRDGLPDPPAPPPSRGRDPLVQRSGDKAMFFRGDWRQAWPRDFRVSRGPEG